MLLDDRDNLNGSDGDKSEYEPGQQFRSTYQPAELDDNDAYQSQNADRSIADDFPDRAPLKERLPKSSWDAFNQAKSIAGRRASREVSRRLFGDKNALNDNSNAGRDKVKELAKEKAREFAKNQISKKIANEGVKKGIEKGLSKGASSLAKEAAKKAAGKVAGKTAAKGAAQAATKGLQTAVTAAGGATGIETLGLGFVIAFLVNIAISLGIEDAIDGLFELKAGNFKKARFLIIRAGAKVGMLIVLLVSFVGIFSVAGIIIALPIVLLLNIYMILGLVFPNVAIFQGLVWWENLLVIFADFAMFIIAMAFLAGIGWYVCDQAGYLSSDVVSTGLVVAQKFIDWWNGTDYQTTVAEMCKSIKAF